MTINAIEQALIAHLKRTIVGVVVQSFPAKPADYNLQTANAAILVRFVDEKADLDNLGKAGERQVFFDINIVGRDFKSQTGVYAFYDAVKRALDWVQFGEESGTAAGLIAQFRGGKYDSYDTQKGLWFYAQRFSFRVPYAPQPIAAQAVTQITIADITTYPDDLDNPDIIVVT